MTIRARHIPGRLNRLADLLSSKGEVVNTEWTLCSQVASQIWPLWGKPHLDLMATRLNNRLPVLAHDVDAMSLS